MLATCTAIDNNATRIAGIGFIEHPVEFQTIHIYDGSDAVTIFETNDVDPEVKAWVCLESSIEGDVLFVGGASGTNFDSSDAFLLALTFDENADTLAKQRFGSETELKVINSLRRHPEGNILFAGCQGFLAVILFHNSRFHLIKKVKNVIGNPITDIAYNFNTVYTVCDHDRAMIVYFDEDDLKSRDPALREKPHGMYRGAGGPTIVRQPSPRKSYTLAQKYRARDSIAPKYASMFRDYDIRQINLPGGKFFLIFS